MALDSFKGHSLDIGNNGEGIKEDPYHNKNNSSYNESKIEETLELANYISRKLKLLAVAPKLYFSIANILDSDEYKLEYKKNILEKAIKKIEIEKEKNIEELYILTKRKTNPLETHRQLRQFRKNNNIENNFEIKQKKR